ncbi:uncharacterized protein LOC106175829 [Lingula anatina]|uniref:Uncharacterized protein LOC106175829 n=1 Tax=Lingula anatina TaxID=7574 RepID=A0A1S3JSZ2_LINAN|nr:uncharacterized protein LOC106175829 [Lingula anatina]|eukprot:XP_013413442.1 uncharacterized protein LOC106175829 [Lingula anatina]
MPKYGDERWCEEVLKELRENGLSVLEDVIQAEECDTYRQQYHTWVTTLREDGEWPKSKRSLIQHYRVGHLEATWAVRLKTKPVFAKLWGTNKLLSSIDAVAIGRPPEGGEEEFHTPDCYQWLHLDQSAKRVGLHAYQGSVQLEDTAEDDWCFVAMPTSVTYFDEFCRTFPHGPTLQTNNDFYRLKAKEVEWYKSKGCEIKRIAAPKGSMILWDSRTVHANAPPMKNRNNPGRWRYVVFVAMAPAIWASAEDMQVKKRAYKELRMTQHWPAQGVNYFQDLNYAGCKVMKTHSKLGRSEEVRLLAGDLEYDFNDGEPNGPEWRPQWNLPA